MAVIVKGAGGGIFKVTNGEIAYGSVDSEEIKKNTFVEVDTTAPNPLKVSGKDVDVTKADIYRLKDQTLLLLLKDGNISITVGTVERGVITKHIKSVIHSGTVSNVSLIVINETKALVTITSDKSYNILIGIDESNSVSIILKKEITYENFANKAVTPLLLDKDTVGIINNDILFRINLSNLELIDTFPFPYGFIKIISANDNLFVLQNWQGYVGAIKNNKLNITTNDIVMINQNQADICSERNGEFVVSSRDTKWNTPVNLLKYNITDDLKIQQIYNVDITLQQNIFYSTLYLTISKTGFITLVITGDDYVDFFVISPHFKIIEHIHDTDLRTEIYLPNILYLSNNVSIAIGKTNDLASGNFNNSEIVNSKIYKISKTKIDALLVEDTTRYEGGKLWKLKV